MKIKFNKSDLCYATRVVSSMVPPQTSLPILGNILIQASGDVVTFFASDMESSIKCKIQAHVEEEGEATVPAGPFATLVPELPDVEIFIWLDDDENVHIEAEKTRYRLQTMSPEDFPSWSDFEPLTSFVLEQKVLKEMIDKTLFAIPPKDPRKVLLGGLLIVDKQFPEYMNIEEVENPTHLRLVATDGKKLSYVDAIASNVVGQDETRSIIPLKILSEIHKLLRDEGVVKIGLMVNSPIMKWLYLRILNIR
jgi:DNA polymerase III subunit beta